MRGIFLGLVLQVFFSGLLFGSEKMTCSHGTDVFRCVEYVRTYDGDTVFVRIPGVHPLLGEEIGIRVLGVDAPEKRGSVGCERTLARRARDFVHKQMSQAKRLELRSVKRGKYFRVVAEVYLDGTPLSSLLTSHHLAVAYDGGTKNKHVNWCRMLRRYRVASSAHESRH